MTKSLFKRPLDLLFVIYFLTHIPITLLVDAQVVLPASFFPKILSTVFTQFATTFQDPLLTSKPIWFQSFTACEVFLQLPFFFFALYGIIYGIFYNRKFSAHC